MNKKGITLAAGVVVIGCLFGTYFALKSHNEEAESALSDTKENRILTVDADKVAGISFQIGDTVPVFLHTDDAWTMEGDDTFPVDSSSVAGVLENLSDLTAVRTLEDTAEGSEYGMDEPQNVITVIDSDGQETRVTVGATNSTTGDDYVMLNDDPSVIYTVDSGFRTSISDDLYDYAVSETIPDILAADINGVTVSGKDGYKIYRDDDTWCVEDAEGSVLHADKDAVNSAFSTLASSLGYLDYLEHNCQDGAEYGLDDPTAAFTVLYEEEEDQDEQLTFYVGGVDANGNYYVQQEGSKEVHTISASVLSPFVEVTAADWEEPETEAESET